MKHIKIFSLTSEYETSKSGGTLITPNVSLINEDNSVRYLPELEDPYNGYEYVDLGLPSGLKWATCNVGASSPEYYGLYFAWGETTGYTDEQVYFEERAFSQDEYNAGPAASIDTDLTLEQDAAHVNMGGNWRMPTNKEMEELVNNCDAAWTYNYNNTGAPGYIFTSKVNGNSVFFPAAGVCKDSSRSLVGEGGLYWEGSCYSSDRTGLLVFNSGGHQLAIFKRYYGLSVRGVFK